MEQRESLNNGPRADRLVPGQPLGLSVLLAEDDPVLRARLSCLLRQDGHGVVELGSAEALAQALRRRLAEEAENARDVLVLADGCLPLEDSFTLLRALRLRGRRPRVALVTTFADTHVYATVGELDALALFAKPFDINLVRVFVRHFARWQR